MNGRFPGAASAADGLLSALKRLDELLGRAVAAAEAEYGDAGSDAYRGLYIDLAEVTRLLERSPGEAPFRVAPEGADADGGARPERLRALAAEFGLSDFDVDVVMVALGPELDLRYERLYAYLQDDVTRRRPTVDLTLNLLCGTSAARLDRRSRFSPDAPLLRHGLLRVVADPNQSHPPLLSHALKLDESVVRFLLEQPGLAGPLVEFCRLSFPAEASTAADRGVDGHVVANLRALLGRSPDADGPLRLYLRGRDEAALRAAAAAAAEGAGVPLLAADVARAPTDAGELRSRLRAILRTARLYGATVVLYGVDVVRTEARQDAWRVLRDAVAAAPGAVLLAGSRPWGASGVEAAGVVTVEVRAPGFERRRARWSRRLAEAGHELEPADLDALADRFRLLSSQIDAAAVQACGAARWRAAADGGDAGPTRAGLFAAARAQSGYELGRLARKIEPVYGWDDLVLPDDAVAQLREVRQRVTHRRRVLEEWGFGRKLAHGKGVTALFSGRSGTGKTMAAQVIAGALGLDLYRIDLSAVVSKYIGETEKNLARVFSAAEASNAILFFDEADALFGKRSEVKDSHDRYANIEISYLLQRMEDYDGVTILATNLRKNMDEAFVRRLAFSVGFPFPEAEDRRRIWERAWPSETPRADDLDLAFLADRLEITGGNIKNIVLAAAFLAAEADGPVQMEHVVRAAKREYQKMGKVVVESDFGPYYELVSDA